MNQITRIKMVKAMEFIARQVNNEETFMDLWLAEGVADGDVRLGDLQVNEEDPDLLEYYTADGPFADLMGLFLRLMIEAEKDGGLYCDDVCSDEGGEDDAAAWDVCE